MSGAQRRAMPADARPVDAPDARPADTGPGDMGPADLAAQVAAVRRDAIKGKRRLASSVLAMEVVVFWLAIIVAVVMSHVPAAVAVPVGVALALMCVVVAARITRPWAYPAGSVLQVIAIGCGFVVHTMFFVGAVFAILWIAALRVGDAAMRVANRYAASVAAGALGATGAAGAASGREPDRGRNGEPDREPDREREQPEQPEQPAANAAETRGCDHAG